MPTIHAIYEHGVFRPTEPVNLDEATEVVFEPRVIRSVGGGGFDDSHFISRPKPMTAEELEAWLSEMAAMSVGDYLPADRSRADIYDGDEPVLASTSRAS